MERLQAGNPDAHACRHPTPGLPATTRRCAQAASAPVPPVGVCSSHILKYGVLPCYAAATGVPGGMQPGRFMGEMVELGIFRRANESIAQAARETMEVRPRSKQRLRDPTLFPPAGMARDVRHATLPAQLGGACVSAQCSCCPGLTIHLPPGTWRCLLQARQLLGSGLPQVDEAILKAAKAGLFINLLTGGGLAWPADCAGGPLPVRCAQGAGSNARSSRKGLGADVPHCQPPSTTATAAAAATTLQAS